MIAVYHLVLMHAVRVHEAAHQNMRRVIDQIVADITT
ncbi:hypothetical protein BH09PSE6_BH09PSE6_07140 [soil metagenome]